MLKKIFIVLIIIAVAAPAVVVLACLIVLAVWVVLVLLIYYLIFLLASYLSTWSLNPRKHRILAELHQVGKPAWHTDDYYNEPCVSCPKHNENCTPQTCQIKQAEAYQALVESGLQLRLKPWRINLAAA